MSTLSYRPMRADPSDLVLFGDCFARNESPRSTTALEWQYFRNPTGELIVDLALPLAEDRVAAIYAVLPVFMRIQGERRLAVQSLDTLTDADHRGKGLFVKLAASTFARAAERGAALVYGFPNGNSAHGFFRKLDWSSLDPVPFLIRPLRTRYVAERLRLGAAARFIPDVALGLGEPRIPRRLRLETMAKFDARFDDVWSRFSSSVGVAVERDSAYLNWRLVDKPHEHYVTLALFEGDALVAFVTYAVKEKHGGRIGYVMELLNGPGRTREARWLLRKVIHEMTTQGADVALAWSFAHSPNYRAYLLSGFLPFPARMRPIELHLGVRPFDKSIEPLVKGRSNWYVSYLDSDTV
jgi:hypothetical protein